VACPRAARFRVVSKVSVSDGRATSQPSSYSYNLPTWSYRNHTLLGWTKVSASYAAVTNRPAVTTYRIFNQDDICLTEPREWGQLDSVGGNVGARKTVSYDNPGTDAPFGCQPSYRSHVEYAGTGVPRKTLSLFSFFGYDEFGNPTSVLEQGRTPSGFEFAARFSKRRYDYAPVPYIVDRLAASELHDGRDVSAKLLQSALYCYDGDTSPDCGQAISKGLVTRKIDIEDSGTRATDFNYDPAGNLAGIQDANSHTSTISFDPVEHLYPLTRVNTLGQTTQTLEWDRQLGVPTKITDLNGAVTQFEYDPFGRPIVVTGPAGLTVRRSYHQRGPGEREVRQQISAPRTPSSLTVWHFDGLGRLYQIDQSGRSAGELITNVLQYSDASNRPWRGTRRFVIGTVSRPEYETYTYDAAGKLLAVDRPGGKAQFEYDIDTTRNALSATSIDESLQRRQSLIDVFNRLIETRSFDAAAMSKTRYDYDGRNQLNRIIDNNGNETYFEWDLLGRQTLAFDPNLGSRTPVLDQVGNLQTLTDASAETIAFGYDDLDRLTSKTYPNGQTVRFHYDEPGHGAGMGRLTSMSDLNSAGCPHDVSASYTYDLAGNITTLEQCFKGSTSVTNFRYDPRGLLREIIYPGGERVGYKYNPAGWPTAASGYVNSAKYDIDGRLTIIDFSNSITGSFSYDPNVGDLATQSFSGVSTKPFDAQYTYQPNGLLATSSSTTNAMNLTYSHDSMSRLRSVRGNYFQTFTYDGVGNIQTNSALGTYTYPPQGNLGCSPNGVTRQPCAQPHGVQAAGPLKFSYDANGLLRDAVDTVAHTMRHIDWTSDHLPMTVHDYGGQLTEYSYDGFGNLVHEASAAETTTYFNTYVSQTARGITKNYFFGSSLIAVVAAGKRLWTYADRAGSIRAIGDDGGQRLRAYDYKAFGEPLGPSTRTLARFNTEPIDFNSGLVHLGARFYDPTVGRFLSADTILPDVLNTQAANRYAFAYNSPVAYIDPSGHQPLWITQPYGPSPGPSADFGSWMYDKMGYGTGQICSACRANRSIYATPVAVDPPNYRNILARAQADLGITLDTTFENVQRLAERRWHVDWQTGLPVDTPDFDFGVMMFGAYANLGEAQAQALMWYDMAAANALKSATQAAKISGNRPTPTPRIGAARGSRGRPSLFNPKGYQRNCSRCVASLLDHIANEGDMIADQYPAFASEKMEQVIPYLEEQVGVRFGERLSAPMSVTGDFGEAVPGALPEGDYVIFNRLDRAGMPGHVLFARSLGGQMWFYDPQIDVGVPFLFERYYAYPIIYPP